MIGSSNGNQLDAGNANVAKARQVHVDHAPYAYTGCAAPDQAFNSAEGLNQESNRYRWELRVEVTKECYQPVAREETVDDE
jgi:hypothetical protein